MIGFRVDPARAREAATQRRERLGDIGGKLKTGEDAGHGRSPYMCQTRRLESTFALLSHANQELLDLRQNSADDHIDAGRRRVQAVALVELGVTGDAVKEERIEQRVI